MPIGDPRDGFFYPYRLTLIYQRDSAVDKR